MKRNIFNVSIRLLCWMIPMLIVSGCDLTRKPTSVIPLDESLLNYSDAVRWNRGIYTQFRNRQGGTFVTPQEIMGDLLNASADFANRGGFLHGWVDLTPSQEDYGTMWRLYYSTMKNINKTLSGYDTVREDIKSNLSKTSDKKEISKYEKQLEDIDRFEGESHFARAYYYFCLMQRFGMPYNAATASTDNGVPIVLVFDVGDQVRRASVKECYDQIFKDLNDAESKLSVTPNRKESEVFTPDCITALRARIYLEMKEYEKAYAEADKLISSGRYPLVKPEKKSFEDMWRHDTSTEFIMLLPLRKGEEKANSMGSYYGLNPSEKYHTPDWLPTKGFISKFSDQDLRVPVYFESGNTVYFNNKRYSGVTIISKFKGNPAFATETNPTYGGLVPNGQQRPKVFRIPEQYLIKAEAAYRIGKDALTPLNALRVSRGLDALKDDLSGEKLLQEIKDERLRELALEGFRLFDLRRWGDPMIRMPHQVAADGDASFITLDEAYVKLVRDAKDPKFVFPVPQHEINVYGKENMPQNPGW